LPRFLPREALSRTPDWGTLRPDLDIPVEDLKDGFHKSAMVGQEIYGSGISFRFAAEAYRVLGGSRGVVLFAEYPITASTWRDSNRTLEFRLGGTADYRSRVRVYFRGKSANYASRAVQVIDEEDRASRIDLTRAGNYIEFFAPGGQQYRMVVSSAKNAPAGPVQQQPRRDAIPTARVARILGAGGVLQLHVGGSLSVPLVLDQHGPSAVDVIFEADLPAGWQFDARHVRLPPGAEVEHGLRVVPLPADLATDHLHPIAIRMRSGSTLTPILETLVRGVARTDDAVGESYREFRVSGENGSVSVQDGMGLFMTTRDGAAAFDTRVLTVDVDRFPFLDFRVAAITGTWAVKVYEADGSPWGIYVLPEIPVVPEARATGWFRVRLPERTGWSGIHSFKVTLFVVGREGSTLRLGDWRLADREVRLDAR
jgi:hypothetical protein